MLGVFLINSLKTISKRLCQTIPSLGINCRPRPIEMLHTHKSATKFLCVYPDISRID